MAGRARGWLFAACALLLAGQAAGQVNEFPVASPFKGVSVLIVDQESLLTGSRLGQDILARNKADADALREEGAALDLQFEAEERSLTEKRADMTPAEFRAIADAFDEKVIRTRADQQEKSNALAERLENRRIDFFQQVAPILAELLQETGAAAVIDERTVLISNEDLNITDEVIKRLDDAFLAAGNGNAGTEDQDDPKE